MTFKINNLTAKNFMSVGNVTQAINFDRQDLTLVLGENLDLGGDDGGARNGTGKTTIINALSYVFFGQALTNIKKDNLINKTNAKGTLVTIDFEKDNISYKIERGRKPNVLKFYKGDIAFDAKDDDAQGDSRETQQEIERLLQMSADMFRHIVALNTYTEPFLSLRANDQRTIIEQLLGITLLSEKATALKEEMRIAKDTITSEEYRIKAVQEANKKIEEQVSAVKRRRDMWDNAHNDSVNKLVASVDSLEELNIEHELSQHELLAKHNENQKSLSDLISVFNRASDDKKRENLAADKLIKELRELSTNACHSCGQALHGPKHEELTTAKNISLKEHHAHRDIHAEVMADYEGAIKEVKSWITAKPMTHYSTVAEALNHKNTLQHIHQQLERKVAEVNPYTDQIKEMEETAIVEISYENINKAMKLKEHQEVLLKLLTNKDSFIRKRIIDQNLTYLNARLSYYLDTIGLPHSVTFQNDLTVEITELGRDLDFDNLSRGERNRLILSLSWAFRDVWESLYQPINLLFIDELIDSGLDTAGVESAMGILKRMARDSHKSVWLVSHKDELTSRVNNILRVQKEGGFTSYSTDVEPV